MSKSSFYMSSAAKGILLINGDVAVGMPMRRLRNKKP